MASQAGLKPEKPTVLVVEDEVLLRLMIAEELRNQESTCLKPPMPTKP